MYSKVGLSTILLTKSILYVTGACYWYWVMLLEILGPHADFNVAIKDTLQPLKMITIRPFHFTGYFWPEVIDSRLTFGQLTFQSMNNSGSTYAQHALELRSNCTRIALKLRFNLRSARV